MSSSGFLLCLKCARYAEDLLREGKVEGIYPWDHCHHESKEKVECWCDRPVSGMPAGWRYCPHCGRILGGLDKA